MDPSRNFQFLGGKVNENGEVFIFLMRGHFWSLLRMCGWKLLFRGVRLVGVCSLESKHFRGKTIKNCPLFYIYIYIYKLS